MLRTGIVVIMIGFATLAFADSVQSPALQPNDTWAYRKTVEKQPNVWKQTHITGTVVRNSGSTILLRNTEVGSTNPPLELLLNADWSRFRSLGGKETIVHRPLAFPLAVGKSWDVSFTDDHPANTQHKSETHQMHYRAVAWEDVDTPAGKFKAIKIEADGTWSGDVAPSTTASATVQAGANGSQSAAQTTKVTERTVTGRIYEAVWYAPEVKRAVKSVEEYYDANGVRNERTTLELESYDVTH